VNRLSATTATHYRPDIDGLRALAVLAVVGYHAFPKLFSGGFIGVDIFFVISGYLIAKIIFQEMLHDKFTVRGFYIRRIKRIFPALILVSLTTFLIGWHFLSPFEFHSLGTNLAGSSAFIQNFVLLNQVGYFDLAAEKKPLLHLWSLGIEEQYYIFWPLLLLGMYRLRLNAINLTFFLCLLSLIPCLLLYKKNPTLAFYSPLTRCWELLLGASLAIQSVLSKEFVPFASLRKHSLQFLKKIIWEEPPAAFKETTRHNIYAVIALALIIYGFCHFNQHTHYPSYRAFIPVIAAMLLISASSSWINTRFLSSRLMVLIGLISYPLYLWHYPLITYAKILTTNNTSTLLMAGLVFLSFLLAGCTYYLIERPIRFNKTHKIAPLVGSMILLGCLGLFVTFTEGLPSRMPPSIRPFMLTGEETSIHWRRGQCLLLPEQSAAAFSPTCTDQTGPKPLIFVWGDSYAAAFYAGLNNLKKTEGYRVAEYTASACPPLLGFVHTQRRFCKGINDRVLQEAAAAKPDIVILHSTWRYAPTVMAEGLRATVAALRALNIHRIILLGPVPTWLGDSLAQNVFDYYLSNHKQVIPARTQYRLNAQSDEALDLELKAQAALLGIEYLAPRQIMCNSEGCLARIGQNGNELSAFDTGHMTLAGATYLVHAFLPKILPS